MVSGYRSDILNILFESLIWLRMNAAACLTHASRTKHLTKILGLIGDWVVGVSNAWVTCPVQGIAVETAANTHSARGHPLV